MNFLKMLFSASVGLAMGTNFIIGGDAVAGTLITATVTDGDTTQGLENVVKERKYLQDGDFLIKANVGDDYAGNGRDEGVYWDFDFSNNLYLDDFRNAVDFVSGTGLKRALLTFELTPENSLVTTDFTRIDNSEVRGDRQARYGDLDDILLALREKQGMKTSFTIDLLGENNLMDESALLDAFDSRKPNSIPFLWTDDVIMHSATLTLETVPEPATILGLLVLGTIGSSTIKRKKETV